MRTQWKGWACALSCVLTAGLALGGCAPRAASPAETSRAEAAAEAWEPLSRFYAEETLTAASEQAARLRPQAQGLRSWQDLTPALARSRAYVATRDPEQVAVARGDVTVTWAEIAAVLNKLERLLPDLDRDPQLLARSFRWLGLNDGAEFSGYYEPVIKASRQRRAGFTYPIYRLPPDLRLVELGDFGSDYLGQRLVYRLEGEKVLPYYSRTDIDDKGVLRGKKLELAWLADPLDGYFLHVQGSGRLRFEDGTETAVAWAGSNGRRYSSLGRYLSDMGMIPAGSVSMNAIRDWLQQHPEEGKDLLRRNERYIFFREEKGQDTPVGGMGRVLSPWISLAVDRDAFPLGSLLVFTVDLPRQGEERPERLTGIGLAQDVGAAILGRRVDLFCGRGEEAAFTAGYLNSPGQAWLLLPLPEEEKGLSK